MLSLSLEWQRCPAGVELLDCGPRKRTRGTTILGSSPEPEGWNFRYRTDERVTYSHALDLKDPVFVRYANADSDDELAAFLSRFGMPDPPPLNDFLSRDWLKEQTRRMWELAITALASERVALKSVNAALKSHRGFALQGELELPATGDGLQVRLRPQGLIPFMLWEVAMAATAGARFQTCAHCGTAFLTGSMTGNRAHAVYHADKCRVAAMRARNAASHS